MLKDLFQRLRDRERVASFLAGGDAKAYACGQEHPGKPEGGEFAHRPVAPLMLAWHRAKLFVGALAYFGQGIAEGNMVPINLAVMHGAEGVRQSLPRRRASPAPKA